MNRNYYELLQVDPDAEPEQIDSAYRARVLKLQGKHDGVATEELKLVAWAHKMLMDPEKRAQYDLKLKREAFEHSLDERRLQSEGTSAPWWRSKAVIGAFVVLVVLMAFFFARR